MAEDFDAKTLALIERHGYAVIKVREDDEGPGFAYSVGLEISFQHPEILMIGLDVDLMHRILNDVGAFVARGTPIACGRRYDDFLEGYDCIFREVPRESLEQYVGRALAIEGEPRVLQLIYPDAAGLFPWEAGCDAG